MERNQLCDRLLGALIGLARATDGSEHLISPSSTTVARKALAATAPGARCGEEILEQLLQQVDAEKRKMVPDCFTCACPCGRTAAYDMARLQTETEEVRSLKLRLLRGIQAMAAGMGDRQEEAVDRFYYAGLIFTGMEGCRKEELLPIVQEMEALSQKYMR